jgi:thiol-disulfide isomerase/thioredoxin/outer membrane lipoprotein-sorting protein
MVAHAVGSLVRCRFLLAICAMAALLSSAGCQQDATTRAEAPDERAAQSPRGLLEQMAEAYRNATSYEDVGELRFLVDGAPEDEFRSVPFSVSFQRPNKIRIHALDTTLVADGRALRAMIQALPGQVLAKSCPAKLTSADLSDDKMLGQAMRGRLDVGLPQLTLLLDGDAIKTFTDEGTAAQRPDAEFQGKPCHRVAVRSPQGMTVFWIDAESHLLRKLELPLDLIRKEFPLASLWVEFTGARMDHDVDPVAFQMELPQDVRLLKQFVMPGPIEPSPLLAKAAEDFSLVDLQGATVDRESLKGKIVVLDMWATWCQWCFEGLPLLEQVYQKYKDNDQIVFLAVCRDEPAVTDQRVRLAFENHKLTIPIVRDLQEITEKVFSAPNLPTMVVLGGDGSIQDYHVGYDAQLAETLPQKLDKLLAGENLAKQELETYQREQKEYEQRLAEAVAGATDGESSSDLARKNGAPQ